MGNDRIMIVEDRESISNAIKDMLTVYDKEIVAIAATGKEAVELFALTSPNIVLMDILLPDISGFEVTAEILERSPETKIIAMSALTGSDTRKRAMDAGCIDLLVKPFRMKELIDMIEGLGN